jgi:hypothetical protein
MIFNKHIIEIKRLIVMNGIWSSPGALRPAPSFWRAARGTPPTSRADQGLKSAFEMPILPTSNPT